MKMVSPMAGVTPSAWQGMGWQAPRSQRQHPRRAIRAAASATISQRAGFNGQIKSKNDVNEQYQLFQTGQTTPGVQNALPDKTKSDGGDVLTPMLQAATNVLTEVTKK